MMKKIRFSNFLRRLARGIRTDTGTSAIEFAFIAPVLVAMAIGIIDVGRIAIHTSNMQTAVRASIQSVLLDGLDLSTATAVGNQAWSAKPSDGSMSATRRCECDSAVAACGQVCADGSYPEIHVSVAASGTLGGDFIRSTKYVTETVRLR